MLGKSEKHTGASASPGRTAPVLVDAEAVTIDWAEDDAHVSVRATRLEPFVLTSSSSSSSESFELVAVAEIRRVHHGISDVFAHCYKLHSYRNRQSSGTGTVRCLPRSVHLVRHDLAPGDRTSSLDPGAGQRDGMWSFNVIARSQPVRP